MPQRSRNDRLAALGFLLPNLVGFLLMVVPLAVFFALQRYFVQGLLAGSVKS